MSNIAPLAKAWLEAKRAEDKAKAERIRIEEQMVSALDAPQEGSKTHKIDGYKITTTQPVSRKIDVDAWDKVKAKIPENMWPVKVKIEADATGCKYLSNNEPKMWKAIASAFTVAPAKVSFKVEEV